MPHTAKAFESVEPRITCIHRVAKPKAALQWSEWVTPKPGQREPIHRWFLFPHSFSREIVNELLVTWKLSPGSKLLDPFAGAGTTLLAAKQYNYSAIGYDLSPLAVFVSNVKVAHYTQAIVSDWERLVRDLSKPTPISMVAPPEILKRAFTSRSWDALMHIRDAIAKMRSGKHRAFFELALLVTLSSFSRAQRSGGWLRWVSNTEDCREIIPAFKNQVRVMLEDVSRSSSSPRSFVCRAYLGDARALPSSHRDIDAVITSPPYPNRHDYSRIFNIELSFSFLSEQAIRRLRSDSFRSHVEARPMPYEVNEYERPARLAKIISSIKKRAVDQRVPRMIDGYFEDIFLNLRSMLPRLKKGAPLAYIVGNVRYHGITIPVDQITAEIGSKVGLKVNDIFVARYRGNSAQQMGKYGRSPSRESVLVMSKIS